MSRKKFDEFYNFDGDIEKLKFKLSSIKISGISTTRALSVGGFFFGIHDNDGKNKRLAIVCKTRDESENLYNQLFGA